MPCRVPRSVAASGVVLLILAGNAVAQPCPSQGSATIRLVSSATPAPGVRITFEVSGAAQRPFAVAADVGPGPVVRPRIGTICLDLGPRLRVLANGIPGGSPRLDEAGRASVIVALPPRPTIGGRTFHVQAFVLDPAAPNGFAISPRLDLHVERAILETFESTLHRDETGTTALWSGDGEVVGRSSSPREVVFGTPGPKWRSPDPLVAGGLRTQMVFEAGRLAAIDPGESIVGMSWGPISGAVAAATYLNIRLLLGDARFDTYQGGLRSRFDDNYYEPPVQVFSGSYRLAAQSGAEWVAWPPFERDFPFDGTRHLLFEVNVSPGAENSQSFRQNRVAGVPITWHAGNADAATRFQGAFVDYHTLFRVALVRTVAQSTFYDTGLDDPDYDEPSFIATSAPDGAEISIWLEGADDADRDGAPDPGTASGFELHADAIDGKRLVRFRVELRASVSTGEVPRVDSVTIPFR